MLELYFNHFCTFTFVVTLWLALDSQFLLQKYIPSHFLHWKSKIVADGLFTWIPSTNILKFPKHKGKDYFDQLCLHSPRSIDTPYEHSR